MPFYPALPAVPTWREQENPVRDLAAGIETGQDIYGKALRSQAEAEALRQVQTRREAMRQYQETGDPKTLYPALTPEQALEAPGHLAKQQADLANAAVQYWDTTKASLTKDTYPAWRDETLRRFPQVNPAMFPDPSMFKSEADFTNWKYQREAMAARFKAMSQGAKLSGGYYIPPGGGSPQALPPRPVDEARAEYYKARIGQGERRLDIAEERVRQGRPAGGGRAGMLTYDRWLQENPGGTLKDYNDYVAGITQRVAEARQQGKGGPAAKQGKTYSPAEQEKILADKVLNNIQVPSKLKSEYERATDADKQKIIRREKDRLRPLMFPKQAGLPAGGQYTLPSRDDPTKMIPATKEQFDAWHGVTE